MKTCPRTSRRTCRSSIRSGTALLFSIRRPRRGSSFTQGLGTGTTTDSFSTILRNSIVSITMGGAAIERTTGSSSTTNSRPPRHSENVRLWCRSPDLHVQLWRAAPQLPRAVPFELSLHHPVLRVRHARDDEEQDERHRMLELDVINRCAPSESRSNGLEKLE